MIDGITLFWSFIDSGMKPHTLGSFGPQGIEREIIEALSAQHSNLNA